MKKLRNQNMYVVFNRKKKIHLIFLIYRLFWALLEFDWLQKNKNKITFFEC